MAGKNAVSFKRPFSIIDSNKKIFQRPRKRMNFYNSRTKVSSLF